MIVYLSPQFQQSRCMHVQVYYSQCSVESFCFSINVPLCFLIVILLKSLNYNCSRLRYPFPLVYQSLHLFLIGSLQRSATTQRSKLMQGTQTLNRTTESIARSHQIAAETDQIGVEIIDELGQQRESLVRTKERVSSQNGL